MAEQHRTNGHTVPPGSAHPLNIFAALQSRAALAQRLGMMFDGRRNLHELLGYKLILQYRDLKARYLRQHIAHRVVRIYPEATWAQPPSVDEDNTSDTDTEFEAAWKALEERLYIFQLLERTDILANLGQYACLLIGLKGQSDLSVPATPVQSSDDVIYLTPYSEEFAQVTQLEMNAGLPTFGQPLYYTFHFGRGSTLAQTGPMVPTIHGRVHASRVLHVAEDVLDDEVYAIPRLEPLFDLFDDIYKVEGGSAEQFYQDAKKRLVFALRDEYTMSDEDAKNLTAEVEEFVHELRPYVRLQGMDVTAIPGTVASPKEHMDVILMLIASTVGCPKRMLEGTERGNLASSQDEAAWLQRVQRRQAQFGERRMLRPLLDRLIMLNALPTPAQPYVISWDNLLSLSEEQQAAVAKDVATAANLYASGMASTLIPPDEFREVYLGLQPIPDNPVVDMAPAPTEL